ncbi:MAG: M56 family metallopeptidase [Mariniblastus sp.]
MNSLSNSIAFFDSAFSSTLEQMPDWIGWLVYLSLVATVVAMLAIVFQKLAGRRMSARLIYVVWILVCFRFVLVATPESPTSFLNLIQGSTDSVQTQPIEFEPKAIQPVDRFQTFDRFEFESDLSESPLESFIQSAEEPIALVPAKPGFNYVNFFWIAIATAWVLVVTFLLLRLIAQAIGIAKLIRNSEPATMNEVFANKLLGVQKLRKPNQHLKPRLLNRIRISDDVDVPATVGLFRPIVLLPRWCAAELTTKQIEMVLVHEFVHVQRYDVLIQFVSHLAMTLHCFNPMARYVRNRIEEFREITCDQRVIKTCDLENGAGTRLYAETILLFVDRASNLSKLNNHPEWIPGFVGGNKNFIRERILMMDQKKSGLAKVIGLIGTVFLVLVGFTSAQTQENKSPITDGGVEPLTQAGVTVDLPLLPSQQMKERGIVSVPDGGIRSGARIPRDIRRLRGLNDEVKILPWASSDKEARKTIDEANRNPMLLGSLRNSDETHRFPHITKTTKSNTVSVPNAGFVSHSRANWPNRKVILKRSPKPVKFIPKKIIVDGGYEKSRSIVSQLSWEQAATYEFEVFQGKNSAMKKLLDQVIHPDSMKRVPLGKIPRAGMVGLDQNSWGLGTADADQKLSTLLADPKNGFRKVSASNANGMSSTESVRILSQETFPFAGKQFKEGVETEFRDNYSVGTSIEFTPILKGTKLSSAVKIENNSLCSILREQSLRTNRFNGEWKEHPYLHNLEITQAVTVPAGSRFVVWATGADQDSSAKKMAQDDALIVLVKPKMFRREVPQVLVPQEKSIPTFVEEKPESPTDSAAGAAGPKVVAVSHSAEALTPKEIARRLEAKAVDYDVQLFKVRTKELEFLFEANTQPISSKPITAGGQALNSIDVGRMDFDRRALRLGQPGSERQIEFNKQLTELIKKSKAVLESKPNSSALSEKDKTSAIRIGRSFPCEKGRVENGILIKEGYENIQLGHEAEFTYRIHPKTGELITVLNSKFTDVSYKNGAPEYVVCIPMDTKGTYVKRPGIMETELNTTLRMKPSATVAYMGITFRSDDEKQWTTLLLITPRIVHQ